MSAGRKKKSKNPNIYADGGSLMSGIGELAKQQLSSIGQYNAPISDSAKLFGNNYVEKRKNFNKGTGILGALGLNLFNDISQDLNNIESETAGILGSMQAPKQADSLDDALNSYSSFRRRNYSLSSDYDSEFKGAVSSAAQGAIAGTGIVPGWGTLIGAGAGLVNHLVNTDRNTDMLDYAKNQGMAAINRKQNFMENSYLNNISNMKNKGVAALKTHMSAFGGPLGISLSPVNGAIDYMQNEDLMALAGNDRTQRNNMKVSFPSFAFGGALGGYGGDWSNGLTFVGTGGSHEENPLGGVIMGMSQDGRPNQVEQNEYIWTLPNGEKYVFSDRLEVPEEACRMLGLKAGRKGLTFANAADKIQEESSERPNDPIAKRGLNDSLAKLMQIQEEIRMEKEQVEQLEYALGGGLGNPTKSTDDGTEMPEDNGTEKPEDKLPTSGWPAYLMYGPAVGPALGLGITLANKPKYKYANDLKEAVEQYAGSIPRISYKPLGDYLAYTPFDRLYYANELGAQQAATRSGLMNMYNGNAGQKAAALLAAGYNGNIELGDMLRKGLEFNLDQRQKVAEFNKATNQYNSQADLTAQQANADLAKAAATVLLEGKEKELAMRQLDDQNYYKNLGNNLTAMFDNIGDIGRMAQEWYMMNALINNNAFGTASEDMKKAHENLNLNWNPFSWWNKSKKTKG